MHIVLAALGIIATAYFWAMRMRNAANMADEVVDAAQTAIGAVKRYNFRRKAEIHPIDNLDDTGLAAAALAVAFVELGGLPTQDDKKTLHNALRINLRLSEAEAEEYTVFGSWLIRQCPTISSAFTRTARRLRRIAQSDPSKDIGLILDHIVKHGSVQMTAQQSEAIEELNRIMRN